MLTDMLVHSVVINVMKAHLGGIRDCASRAKRGLMFSDVHELLGGLEKTSIKSTLGGLRFCCGPANG